MKTKIRSICVIIAAIALTALLSACAQSDIPDGYQLVACEGDEFRLYVPTQWIVNTAGGSTSAYYTTDAEISVTASKADDADGLTLDEYWEKCHGIYSTELKEYSYDGNKKTVVIGGKSGQCRTFTSKITRYNETEQKPVEKEYKFLQVIAQKDGKTYILTYSAPTESFDSQLETVEGNAADEGIIPYFRFAEPYSSEDNVKEIDGGVKAPDGMKLASTDERPYRLFVPSSWKINNRTDATAAYASDSDRSNINVQMYMTSSTVESVSEHYKRLEEGYKKTFASYYLDSDEEIKIDGVAAHKYTYTVISGGQEYKIVQAIVRKGEMFYYITYTALTENFEKHLPDAERMIENFDIR